MDETNYILSFLNIDNSQLKVIEEGYRTRDDVVPHIGPEVGKILGLILRAIDAKRAMEFGTCIGYSTIWLAEAMRDTGGRLLAIESRKEFFNEAKENIQAAGLTDYVDLKLGDASSIIDDVEGPFDMILQDSAKPLYPVMLERCIKLLRVRGILAADDGLFIPKGYEIENAQPVHQYNQLVFADPRLYSTILPIGDGLTLSVKLCD
jgi:predicted O-methyltransferase YrrM